MIKEEIKELDVFKNGKLEKILDLDFMTEELLEELIELFPPCKKPINKLVKDLTATYQQDILDNNPNAERNNGYLVALYMLDDQRQKGHKSWLAWNIKFNDIYGTITTYNFTSGHANGSTAKAGKSYALLNKPRMIQRVDLTGKNFGAITVLKETGKRQVGDARIEWLCHCNACNRDFTKDSHTVQKMKDCGCRRG